MKPITLKAGQFLTADGEVLAEIIEVRNGKVTMRLASGKVVEKRAGETVSIPRKRKERLAMPLKACVLAVACLWASIASAQWQWSADAAHHDAIVRVQVGNQAGSGVLVSTDPGVVATAKHVVESGGAVASDAAFVWRNGDRTTGSLMAHGVQTDLAFYRVSVPQDAAFIPFANEMPATGQTVEICGYGGPTRCLRHFEGKVLASSEESLQIDAYVISGDSGGAILCEGRLVAINWGGNTTTAYIGEDGNNWPLVYPATGCGLGPMRRILTQCQQGYCPPQQQPRVQGGVIGFGRIRYVEHAPQRGSTVPPASPPAPIQDLTPVPRPSVDVSAIQAKIAAVEARMDAISVKLDALCVTPSSPTELSESDVQKIVGQLLISMEGNPAFRGPQGEPGKDGANGQDGKPANVDIESLAADVVKKLPPVVMEIHSQGKVSRASAPLGKPIAIGQKDRTKK